MTYKSLLAWLYRARRAGARLELSRVTACLARLGHPERAFTAVAQVAGTNGKGSTVAFLEAALTEAGARAGAFTSPHLLRFAERFRVAQTPLDEAALAAAGERVKAADPEGRLTFFERATAMAVCAFAEAGVKVAIFEVGLGGRLDATTAIGADVAAVTGVAMDHQAYLGDTLAAIAAEKAAIFRRGQRAVIGCAGEGEAVPWLRDAARRAEVASLDLVDEAWVKARVGALPLRLAGEHQRKNAACALAMAENLAAVGAVRADAAAFARGLSRAEVSGRLQRIAEAPAVIIDGAHNPHAALALSRSLDGLVEGGPLVGVCGVAADKDLAGVVTPLARRCDAFFATRAQNARAAYARDVAAAAKHAMPSLAVHECERVGDAIEAARALAGPRGTVIAFGSLLVCGEALAQVTGAPRDPIVVTDPIGPVP